MATPPFGYRFLKRVLDVVLASVALLVLLPLLAATIARRTGVA